MPLSVQGRSLVSRGRECHHTAVEALRLWLVPLDRPSDGFAFELPAPLDRGSEVFALELFTSVKSY